MKRDKKGFNQTLKGVAKTFKLISPYVSVVSFAAAIALSVVCIKMNDRIKHYADQSLFTNMGQSCTLLDILNDHGSQIENIKDSQQKILDIQQSLYYQQLNIQNGINRSNRFLDDYNSARVFHSYNSIDKHYLF